jgi:hypothetical protein
MTNAANREPAPHNGSGEETQDEDRIIDDGGGGGGAMNPPASAPPLKRHGDALLDGSGSRQGANPPEEERTADS